MSVRTGSFNSKPPGRPWLSSSYPLSKPHEIHIEKGTLELFAVGNMEVSSMVLQCLQKSSRIPNCLHPIAYRPVQLVDGAHHAGNDRLIFLARLTHDGTASLLFLPRPFIHWSILIFSVEAAPPYKNPPGLQPHIHSQLSSCKVVSPGNSFTAALTRNWLFSDPVSFLLMMILKVTSKPRNESPVERDMQLSFSESDHLDRSL